MGKDRDRDDEAGSVESGAEGTKPFEAAEAQRRLAAIARDLGKIGLRLRRLADELPATAARDRMVQGAAPRDVATELWCVVDDLLDDELPQIVARLERASRVTAEELRERFARLQAQREAEPAGEQAPARAPLPPAGQVLHRAPLPPAAEPTLDDLASLFLALDEQRSPRLLGVLLWLIHSDRQTVRLLRHLVHLALDAADPEDAQAVGRPGWAITALVTARALDHLLATRDWDDPAAELDPAGQHDDDLVPVLRACSARLRRGEGDQARLRLVRQRLHAHLAHRRVARQRTTAGYRAVATRIDTIERQLQILGLRRDHAGGTEPGERPPGALAHFPSTDPETAVKPERIQKTKPAQTEPAGDTTPGDDATQDGTEPAADAEKPGDGETAMKPERIQDA